MARFMVGQVVHHLLFDYRGVICDYDETFQGADSWYERVARSRPPKDQPWYRVLVDGAEHETYVAERNLTLSTPPEPIQHPQLRRFFTRFSVDGYYIRRGVIH
ncbi:MAG: heat shock protein HspQ [Myxococcota bacterium]